MSHPSGLHPPSHTSLSNQLIPAQCRGRCALVCRHSSVDALPQGPSLRFGLFCPDPSTLNRPHPPHLQAQGDFTAERLIRLALAVRSRSAPRRPASGSMLSLACCVGMSSSETPGGSSAANVQFLRRWRWPSTHLESLGTSQLPTLRFPWGHTFRGLVTVRFRYNLPTCSPSCRS